jgi:hypothetical protein
MIIVLMYLIIYIYIVAAMIKTAASTYQARNHSQLCFLCNHAYVSVNMHKFRRTQNSNIMLNAELRRAHSPTQRLQRLEFEPGTLKSYHQTTLFIYVVEKTTRLS